MLDVLLELIRGEEMREESRCHLAWGAAATGGAAVKDEPCVKKGAGVVQP